MQITFRQIILIIITTALSIIAVRISFTFDINKYLETKREIAKNKAKNACTHVYPVYTKDKKILGIKSAYISPSGTLNRVCQRCGTIKYTIDEDEEKLKIEYFLSHQNEFIKREKKFTKLVKKAGY